MLIIKPYGRLGNNISQIISCMFQNITVYRHKFINLKLIKDTQPILNLFPDLFVFNFPETDKTITSVFWEGVDDLTIVDSSEKAIILTDFIIETIEEFDADTNTIIDKCIKPYINYELSDNFNIDFKNDLVIHIRSGDIFDKHFSLTDYIQPPLSYYEKIICENNYRKIFIVTEHCANKNPVILKICTKFKNVYLLQNNIDIDFKIMLNSYNFVSSISTLSKIVNLLSNFKENIFIPRLWLKGNDKFKYIHIDCEAYFNIIPKTYEEKINNILNYRDTEYHIDFEKQMS